MLSKVLRRADASVAQPLVFPAMANRASAVDMAPERGPENAELLERIRTLEGRLTAERQAGFDAGRRQGEAAATSELQPVLQRLAASTAELTHVRSDLRHRAEADAVRMALMIAKKILHRTLSVDEAALTALARVAFEHLGRSESYRITIHPKFAGAIASVIPAGLASQVRIDADAGCALGTLVVHSAEGTIDASVDSQLDEISRGLADRLPLPPHSVATANEGAQ